MIVYIDILWMALNDACLLAYGEKNQYLPGPTPPEVGLAMTGGAVRW